MLQLLGTPRRFCDGLTRRDWLQIGALGGLGLGLSDFFQLQSASGRQPVDLGNRFGQAKACILLLPYGSPPQHETFDPKPDAPVEVRGEFKAISTVLPGVQIDEHLPRIAKLMDRLTVVRSMTHPFPAHSTAYVVSGIPDYTPDLEARPRDPRHYPYIGSVVDYVLRRREETVAEVPRNIALPWKMNSRGGPKAAAVQAGPYAAFLGSTYDPVLTEFGGKGSRAVERYDGANGPLHHVYDPFVGIEPEGRFNLAGAKLMPDMTLNRMNSRRDLLGQLNDVWRKVDSASATGQIGHFQQMAMAMLTDPKLHQALNVQSEPSSMRDNYGMNLFGQSCLLARRLVEAGSRFITVFWDEYEFLNTGWDTHWNHYSRLKDQLLPGFDAGFSGLVQDLDERGMLDETLVVWMSEHGRTPTISDVRGAGRDHWSRAYSIALAGGGVGRGQVIGESDRVGGDVISNPVSPKDILATILHLLGIDPHIMLPDQLGRPHSVVGHGQVRRELLG